MALGGRPGRERMRFVGMIGKPTMDCPPARYCSIASLSSHLPSYGFENTPNEFSKVKIRYYVDAQERVTYLYVESLLDPDRANELEEYLNLGNSKEDIQDKLLAIDVEIACSLIFLFSVCHLLVIRSPSLNFDNSLLRILKVVSDARAHLSTQLAEQLRNCPKVPKLWAAHSRPCIPRIVCTYQVSGKGGSRCDTRKIRRVVEERTLMLLKRNKLLSSLSNSVLFTTNQHQPFVYIHENLDHFDPIQHCVGEVSRLLESIQSNSDVSEEREDISDQSASVELLETYFTDFKPRELKKSGEGVSLHNVVASHLAQMVTEGERSPPENKKLAAVEPVSFGVWMAACATSYSFVLDKMNQTAFYQRVLGALDVRRRFSLLRCKRVYPSAFSHYVDGLPPLYNSACHARKLTSAIAMFSSSAHGPLVLEFISKLKKECRAYWEDGRQLCDFVSVTGHSCTLPVHRLSSDSDVEDENFDDVQVKDHCSDLWHHSHCDCGDTMKVRPDPFSLKESNFDFYATLAEKCCSQYKRFTFPSYLTHRLSGSDLVCKVDRLNISHDRDPSPSSSPELANADNADGGLSERETPDIIQQFSQCVVPVVGPLVDSLPPFPSWSLLCLGPAGKYTPGIGLIQPGFLRRTNLLLPWRVSIIEAEQQSRWQAESFLDQYDSNSHLYQSQDEQEAADISEDQPDQEGVPRCRRNHTTSEDIQSLGYMGLEYECSNGHRFIGWENGSRVSVDDPSHTTQRLLSSDHGVYVSCPAEGCEQRFSRLMRLFVVTPSAPFTVTLQPHVKAGRRDAQMFYMGVISGVELAPSSFYVLRFPFMFADVSGILLPPNDLEHSSFRLQRGVLSLSVDRSLDSTDKTVPLFRSS